MSTVLEPYRYRWPSNDLDSAHWPLQKQGQWRARAMPETSEELAVDSRWPAFFPSQICIVTVTDGSETAVEKVVGPSVVNRFPYIVALSFCVKQISDRHHVRSRFLEILDRGGEVAIQFVQPGPVLDRIMGAIQGGTESETAQRLERIGLQTRPGVTNRAPVFKDAFLVYEGRLAAKGMDNTGRPIFSSPYLDVGSHRICFIEIESIQLQKDIANGSKQISWNSLPTWHPKDGDLGFTSAVANEEAGNRPFIKGYAPRYRFPAANTAAFAADEFIDDMAVKRLHRQPAEVLAQLSNDEARWPCFFPSSLGMITAWNEDGTPAFLPCGSTTVVSRQPMIIAPCISYSRINERYAPRASLDIIRKAGAFGCGVPYLADRIVDAVTYAGNVSIHHDRSKLKNAGLTCETGGLAPILPSAPIFYECKVIGEEMLGTHVMFLGEVQRILVRSDVSVESPLNWFPWAEVTDAA